MDVKSQYDRCTIADFSLGPVLGTGSFGRVLLAHHKQTGKTCAIKALSKAHLVKNQQARGAAPRSFTASDHGGVHGGDELA